MIFYCLQMSLSVWDCQQPETPWERRDLCQSRTTLGQLLNQWKSLDPLIYPQSQPPGEEEGSVRPLYLSERLYGQLTPLWGLGGRERLMTKGQLHARCFHLSPRHPPFSEDKETMTQRGRDLPRYPLLRSGHAGI